jgi:hypothetical protein
VASAAWTTGEPFDKLSRADFVLDYVRDSDRAVSTIVAAPKYPKSLWPGSTIRVCSLRLAAIRSVRLQLNLNGTQSLAGCEGLRLCSDRFPSVPTQMSGGFMTTICCSLFTHWLFDFRGIIRWNAFTVFVRQAGYHSVSSGICIAFKGYLGVRSPLRLMQMSAHYPWAYMARMAASLQYHENLLCRISGSFHFMSICFGSVIVEAGIRLQEAVCEQLD